MKKYVAYAVIAALGSAAVLNLLYITDAMSFAAVQVGGCAIALAFVIHSIVVSRKEDSPIYWKSRKMYPVAALLYCVLALAFVVTLAVAVFSRK